MTQTFFKNIQPIKYEGTETDSNLAFRHYNPDEIILGKRLEEHLRFAIAYWHSFAWEGGDPFGGLTFERPWHPQDNMKNAYLKAEDALDMLSII